MNSEQAYSLTLIDSALNLCMPGFKPFFIDFYEYYKTSNLGEGGRRLLYKAAKIKNKPPQKILDATGGWARDAFYLAEQGFEVAVAERVEPIFLLLQDAAKRAQEYQELQNIITRLNFIHADSKTILTTRQFPIIYLDPMFPTREKSAKVKKDLQILQALEQTSQGDPDELFLQAQKSASERVIVKRPIEAPFLANKKPDFQYLGKTVRFDVYQNKFNKSS